MNEQIKASISRSMPAKQIGEFCRFKNGDLLFEGKVIGHSEGNLVSVETIGYGQKFDLSPKELLPSKGKIAREEQEEEAKIAIQRAKANSGTKWTAGDKCMVLQDEKLVEGKIFEVSKDENGRDYAVVSFDGTNIEDSFWLSQLIPAFHWKIGDYCRAIWSEDNVIYESKILEIGIDGKNPYAVVEFLGYGNSDSVWLEELTASDGEKARQQQIAESQGVENGTQEVAVEQITPQETSNEVSKETGAKVKGWKVEDRCRTFSTEHNQELEGTIKKANDDGSFFVRFVGMNKQGENKKPHEIKPSAGKEARERQRSGGNEGSESKADKKWELGEFCRAVYSEDGVEYEAIIKSIEENDGQKYAVVQFIGYGNEESIWLQNLLDSKGDQEREKQKKEASLEVGEDGTPLKSWKLGDECRALFEVDNNEYEGIIEELAADESGKKYAIVRFVGYGDSQSVWMENLMDSHGKEAIDLQRKAAAEDCPEASSPIDDVKPEEPKVEEVTKEATQEEPKKQPIQEEPKKQPIAEEPKKKIQEEPKEEPKKLTPTKLPAISIKASAFEKNKANSDWKVGDFCRGLCEFDNQEHEMQIIERHPLKPHLIKARVLGFDFVEKKNTNSLHSSRGGGAREAQINAALQKTNGIQPNGDVKPQENKVTPQKPNGTTEEVSCNGDSKPQEKKVSIEDLNNNIDTSNMSLEERVALAEKTVAQLRAKNRMYETMITEMRETNVFLKNQVLLRLDDLHAANVHVNALKAEKKNLMDDIISHKADQE